MPTTRKNPRAVPDVYVSVITLISIGLFLILAPFFGPKVGVFAAAATIYALLAAVVLYALVKRRHPAEVVADERERQIKSRSAQVAGGVVMCIICIGPLALMLACWQQGKITLTIDVSMLPLIPASLGVVYLLTRSITHIVLHWQGAGHGE